MEQYPGTKELECGSVIDTLEKGDFYMSCGPDGTYAATRGYYLHELVEK